MSIENETREKRGGEREREAGQGRNEIWKLIKNRKKEHY